MGNVAFDDRKNLIYRAADGFNGTDKFTYTVTDGQGAVATASVKLIVSPRSDVQLTKTQYVNFMYKKTKLTPTSEEKIQSIVDKIKTIPNVEVEIFAYTDDVGSDRYNLALSERRANVTRDLLISFGIDANKIRSFGMGEKNPIADNATPEGQAINRRGEFRFKFGSGGQKNPQTILTQ